jgi:hypothetical protein
MDHRPLNIPPLPLQDPPKFTQIAIWQPRCRNAYS